MSAKLETLPGFIPVNPIAKKVVEGLTNVFVSHLYLHGRANIAEIRLLQADGKPMIIIGNHLSNVDAAIIDQAFRRNGCDDIADACVYLKGKKLIDEPVPRFLTKMLPCIVVWPPTMEANTPDEQKERSTMNFRAMKSSKEALKQGKNIVIFPEGTRSRSQQLGKAEPQISGYFSLVPDEFIVPLGIIATEKILPVGGKIPRRGEVHIVVGRPLSMVDLNEIYKHLPKPERREAVIDRAMRELAYTLLPRYRGIYADEIGKLREK